MSDPLDQKLRSLRVPEPDEFTREQALAAATAALDQRPLAEPTRFPFIELFRPALAGFALLVLAAFCWPWLASKPPAENPRNEARALAEIQALFPGQINAVITRHDRVDLDLASAPARHSDQAVVIEFIGHGETIRVLGYSGQPVRVRLNTRTFSFEPLAVSGGGVVLDAGDFFWSAAQPTAIDGYQIRTRALPPQA